MLAAELATSGKLVAPSSTLQQLEASGELLRKVLRLVVNGE